MSRAVYPAPRPGYTHPMDTFTEPLTASSYYMQHQPPPPPPPPKSSYTTLYATPPSPPPPPPPRSSASYSQRETGPSSAAYRSSSDNGRSSDKYYSTSRDVEPRSTTSSNHYTTSRSSDYAPSSRSEPIYRDSDYSSSAPAPAPAAAAVEYSSRSSTYAPYSATQSAGKTYRDTLAVAATEYSTPRPSTSYSNSHSTPTTSRSRLSTLDDSLIMRSLGELQMTYYKLEYDINMFNYNCSSGYKPTGSEVRTNQFNNDRRTDLSLAIIHLQTVLNYA